MPCPVQVRWVLTGNNREVGFASHCDEQWTIAEDICFRKIIKQNNLIVDLLDKGRFGLFRLV